MNVLLLHPPATRGSFQELALLAEPVAYLTLGPALAEHRLRFVDLRLARDLRRELRGFVPDVAVVGVVPLTRGALDRTLAELRAASPGVRVVLFPDAEYGNAHVTERPEDFVHPEADALVRDAFLSDLLAVVPEVVRRWGAGQALDDVPGLSLRGPGGRWRATEARGSAPGDYGVPDRTLLGRWRGRYVFGGRTRTAFVFTSFGCRHGCRYCPMSRWSGGIFPRDPDDVVAELAGLEEPNVFLADYEPLQVPEAMAELAERLAARGLRKRFYLMTRADSALAHLDLLLRWRDVGLRSIYLGLDGHSQARLREVRKGGSIDVNERALRGLEALGFDLAVGFVVSPDFEAADFAGLRAYVRRLRPPTVGFTVETPLVGTQLHDERESSLTSTDWSLYDLQHAVLPTRLPLGRFYREMVRLHLFGMRVSTPGVMRSLPLRDQLRAARIAATRLASLWRGARHHAPQPPRQAAFLRAAGV